MSILRLPFALVIGILIALTALIPIAGAFIGCAVGVFLILIEDPVQALVFLGLFFVLQQVEGKLIYPKVVGNFVGLPGIWVLFAITVGGSLFGIVGMLVFIPLTATVYTLLREDVGKRIAQKKSERRENANGKDNIGQYM
jgi:predicted PurR-regulated permease PerM